MTSPYRPLNATEVLDLYFIENRSRLLDIAAFLDRIDRYEGANEARADFRYKAFAKALELLKDPETSRAIAIQTIFSDPTTEPLASATGLKACGAWEGACHEGN